MEKLTLTIKQPEFCRSLGDEVWQYLVHDLKNDKTFGTLCKRYYEAVTRYESNMTIAEDDTANINLRNTKKYAANKDYRHAMEVEKQIIRRTDEFSHYWINKYGSAELTFKEIMAMLKDENKEKFALRAATIIFLADFMEDCFVEINSQIKEVLPDGKCEPLNDFFDMKKKISTYINKTLEKEGGNDFQEFFDEHSASIKMTIYNKVNGFMNANRERIKKQNDAKRQLVFEFKDYGDDE